MTHVVNTSSNVALTVKAFDPATLARPDAFRRLFGAYATSKLAPSLWTQAIADEWSSRGMRVVSVCPGPTLTPMTRGRGMPARLRLIARVMSGSPERGAETLLTARDLPVSPGSFICNRMY